MKRFALLLLLASCADAHLSDGYGRRVRGALDAQTQSRSTGALALDGMDARTVMMRHRGVGVPASLGGTPQQGGAAATGYGAGSAAQSPMNSAGNIRLDAIR
jgi:hypothetical protein